MNPRGGVASEGRVTSDGAAAPDSLTAVVDANGSLLPGASESVVAWWSFTKTLVAACVLLLAEQRRLSLDDRLDDLPCSPPCGLPRSPSRSCSRSFSYTLRQLLQHRAATPRWRCIACSTARCFRPLPGPRCSTCIRSAA
jgi:CubicO group peptidase (beta-lactamase class C family)